MATPGFILELRHHVGHAPLWIPGTVVAILRPTPGRVAIDWKRPIAPEAAKIPCIRRSGNGIQTLVTGVIDPGEEPAIAAAHEALGEANIRIEVHRLLSVRVVGPVTYYNGDIATYLDVAFATQWVSGKSSPADGENSRTTFLRGDQLPPMKSRFHRAIAKALGARPDADFLTV